MNFNWMPLREARKIMTPETMVWIILKESPMGTMMIADLMSNFWDDYLVCRALKPELPNFEEQSNA